MSYIHSLFTISCSSSPSASYKRIPNIHTTLYKSFSRHLFFTPFTPPVVLSLPFHHSLISLSLSFPLSLLLPSLPILYFSTSLTRHFSFSSHNLLPLLSLYFFLPSQSSTSPHHLYTFTSPHIYLHHLVHVISLPFTPLQTSLNALHSPPLLPSHSRT